MEHATGRTVLRAVADFWEREGFGPSLRELKAMAGLSSISVVRYWLGRLECDGLVLLGKHGQTRAVRLTRDGRIEVNNRPP